MDLGGEFLSSMEGHPAEYVIGFFEEGFGAAIGVFDEGDIEVNGNFVTSAEEFGGEELHAFEPEWVSITENNIPGFFDGVASSPLEVLATSAADGGEGGEVVWV